MDILKAEKMARELMDQHALLDWSFEWDRAKRRFGRCVFATKTISLSKYVTEVKPEDEVKDTILHEIAHALVGPGHGHDEVWRRMALKIGSNGQRCYGGEALPGKYVATCKNGHVHYRYRKPKKRSSCGACCKTFNPDYVLKWEVNHE